MCKSNKNVQNLFAENYKTLMKEVKDQLNKWRDHVPRLESIFIEANVPPNWRTGSIQFQSKYQQGFFNSHRQADPKMYIEKQSTRIAKAILKKITFGGIALPNASFKPQRIILRS